MMYEQRSGGFIKGMLTGVVAGTIVYAATQGMKGTPTGKKIEKNVTRAMKDVGCVVDNFTGKFR